MAVLSYLFFEGRCEEAIEFYRQALGAEVMMLMRCREAPPPPQGLKPGTENKILHASLRIGGTIVAMSDGNADGNPEFKGFALTLEVPDAAQAARAFNALSAGGRIVMPLAGTFFSPSFGILADRFGVTWMVMVPQAM